MCRKNKCKHKGGEKQKDDCQLSVSDFGFLKKGFKNQKEGASAGVVGNSKLGGRVGDIQGVYEPENSSRNKQFAESADVSAIGVMMQDSLTLSLLPSRCSRRLKSRPTTARCSPLFFVQL